MCMRSSAVLVSLVSAFCAEIAARGTPEKLICVLKFAIVCLHDAIVSPMAARDTAVFAMRSNCVPIAVLFLEIWRSEDLIITP